MSLRVFIKPHLVQHSLFQKASSPSHIKFATRKTVNGLKVHWQIFSTTSKSFAALFAGYGVSCFAYSQLYPQQWMLSDHNTYLTSVKRISRTLLNAAFIAAFYQYRFNYSKKFKEFISGEKTSDVDSGDNTNNSDETEWREFLDFAAQRVANVMISNGGIYIKVGQALATYSSMMPKEFGDAFKPLLESIFERKSGEIEHMFVQDLGETPKNLFGEFVEEPIAGASIAQVFTGKTKDGERVAIKVQYFDLAKRFNTDRWTIMFILQTLDSFYPGIPILAIMPHIFNALQKELDFVVEANNSIECAEALSNLKYLNVPKVYKDLSSKRILTMEFADGISLVNTDQVIAVGFNPKDIMTKVIEIFSEQIFRTGFIHSDPHPGNIMVRKNEATNDTEIVLIDHGLYERLLPKDRKAFAIFWHSVIIENDEMVQKSGKTLGLNYPDLLASLLFFKPYGSMKNAGNGHGGGSGRGGPFGGSKHERKKREDMTEEEIRQEEKFKEMGHDTIENLPKQLALVFRNLRLIQVTTTIPYFMKPLSTFELT